MKKTGLVLVLIVIVFARVIGASDREISPADSKVVARKIATFTGIQLCIESGNAINPVTFFLVNGWYEQTNAGVQNFAWLPDGRYLAYDFAPDHDMTGWEKKSKIWIVDMKTLETRLIADSASSPSWGSSGLSFLSHKSGKAVSQTISDPVAAFKKAPSPAFNLDVKVMIKFVNSYNSKDQKGLESVFPPKSIKKLKQALKDTVAPSQIGEKLALGTIAPSSECAGGPVCYYVLFPEFFKKTKLSFADIRIVTLKGHKVVSIKPPTY